MIKAIIVEDEKPAQERLLRQLKDYKEEEIVIIEVFQSIESTLLFLNNNTHPDLLFLDIELEDGGCFELFSHITIDIPIIFTTAYNQYMLKAFKVHSIDYLLKPIELQDLFAAIDRFRRYRSKPSQWEEKLNGLLSNVGDAKKKRFMVKINDRYKIINCDEISHFYSKDKANFLVTYKDRVYAVDYSLRELEKLLCEDQFFRINRSVIVQIDAIQSMLSYSSSRLSLVVGDNKESDLFVVSRDRVHAFKQWVGCEI